jgi:LPXTG-motif cell wall-anchored protein
MLSVGKWLFGVARPSGYVPFALVCGAASFGPVSNAELLAFPKTGSGNYFVGMTLGMITLSVGIYWHFRKTRM